MTDKKLRKPDSLIPRKKHTIDVTAEFYQEHVVPPARFAYNDSVVVRARDMPLWDGIQAVIVDGWYDQEMGGWIYVVERKWRGENGKMHTKRMQFFGRQLRKVKGSWK